MVEFTTFASVIIKNKTQHFNSKDMKYSEAIKAIEDFIDLYLLDQAMDLVDKVIESQDNKIELLCYKGKIYSRKQEYREALNIYNKILDIEKDNEVALTSIQMINNILKIRRTFYFENPYTDEELYE